jgi:uncharacterized protein (DUF697 family)
VRYDPAERLSRRAHPRPAGVATPYNPRMPLPAVGDAWRVLKDVDLAAIRREAERRFQLLILADSRAEGERLGALLTAGDADERHPWIRVAETWEGVPAADIGYDAALVLTHEPDPEPALAVSLDTLRGARTPVVTLVRGSHRAADAVVRPGEAARAAVPVLSAAQLGGVAQALVSAVDAPRRLALARQLPPLREAVFKELIAETARANAVYALTTGLAETVPVLNAPLNLADIVVLTKNQLVMSYRIAVAAGKKGAPRDVLAEVAGVIGGGFLFRQGARSLIGLIPGAGIVPKVAVAYAGTVAVGRAVAAWADGGQRLSTAAVKRLYREAWANGKQVAEGLAAQARRVPRRPRWLRR